MLAKIVLGKKAIYKHELRWDIGRISCLTEGVQHWIPIHHDQHLMQLNQLGKKCNSPDNQATKVQIALQ